MLFDFYESAFNEDGDSVPLEISGALQYNTIIIFASQSCVWHDSQERYLYFNVDGGTITNVNPSDSGSIFRKNGVSAVVTPTSDSMRIVVDSPSPSEYAHIMAYCIKK